MMETPSTPLPRAVGGSSREVRADSSWWHSVVELARGDRVHRLFGCALRVAAFAAFVFYVWVVFYAPHRNEPFADPQFEAAVQALNAGHPYHLLYPATGSGPEVLRKMSEGVVDHGVALLMTLGVNARQWLTGTRVTVTPSTGREALMLLFAITAAAIVAPGVPVPVAMAGVLALSALKKWGPIDLGPPVHWGVAFAAVVAAVYLGSVLKTWTWWRIMTLSLLAALAALAQILRQEAAGVSYGVGLALLASAAVALIARRRSGAETSKHAGVGAFVRRATAGGLLLIAANAAAMPLERVVMSRQMGTPFAETPAIAHGSGWPMYLSLGYVSNPFNIAWRDPIGQVHALLISSGAISGSAAVHSTLMREYLSIVVSRPWVLLQNVAAKAARIHALAVRHADPFPDVAVWQRPAHARFYIALPLEFVLCAALLWWRGTPEAMAIFLSSLALAVTASAGALVVFPDYIGGVQGATVALALIVPAAIASALLDRTSAERQIATPLVRRMVTWSAALAVAATAIGAAFVAVQWMRYRAQQEATVARDPVEAIEAQQFRYAHVFNDLPLAQQGRLVARLTNSRAPAVGRIVDLQRGDLDLFRPIALVRTATELHLIAWMGNSFRAPFPSFYQGRTDALFFICGECAADSTVDDFPFDSGWTFVNDLEWRGRYRMFSVLLNERLKRARSFHVAAEKVVALDRRIESTGLRSAPIASARITF